ncbi:MAG TPA: DinB family protein [Gemmatimonadaceae bacterium]
MGEQADWRAIVASSLDWEQAHAKLDSAIADLPVDLRGKRPDGLPHSVWELLDHIRRTLRDLVSFCLDKDYHEPKWPEDYWPSSPAPSSDAEWNGAIESIHRDNEALERMTKDESLDLTAKIPHGTGQTYLRTVIVAVTHSSYHVGQIVLTRRLLGSWKK